MRPVQSGLSPTSARSTVDLPEPLSPTMPKLPPAGTAKETPRTASDGTEADPQVGDLDHASQAASRASTGRRRFGWRQR